MFQFSRAAQEAIKEEKLQDLTLELLKSNTPYDLAEKLALMLIESLKSAPIVVSQEEMNMISRMFRIRGFDQQGNKIARGRKKLDNEDYND